jgi:DNA-binding beta-propeller fold protein YncE
MALHLCRAAIGLLLVAFSAGCVSNKGDAPTEYAFFPPAPDEPRIQYLMSFGSEADLSGRGKFNTFIVGREKLHRPIWKPYGITATPGKLYVVDTMPGNVSITDMALSRLRYIRPAGSGAMQMPINVAVTKDGTIYVTDTERGQVIIFNTAGNYAGVLGTHGKDKPCGIAVDDERVYVTDLAHSCARVYSQSTRELLLTLPTDPANPESRLYQPTNIAVDRKGRIYVSDTGGFAVQVYDAQGKHLRKIGELGLTPGTFALPKGIGVDREQRLYVVDAATGVIQLFDDEGRLLMYFGSPDGSSVGGTYLAAGLAVDYDNVGRFQRYVAPGYEIEYLIYVTNQAGPNKVSVYGFLKRK